MLKLEKNYWELKSKTLKKPKIRGHCYKGTIPKSELLLIIFYEEEFSTGKNIFMLWTPRNIWNICKRDDNFNSLKSDANKLPYTLLVC